jgi:hypothetical protein
LCASAQFALLHGSLGRGLPAVNKHQETAVTASDESIQLVADMHLSVTLHAQEFHAKAMPTRLYVDSVPCSGLSPLALLYGAMCIAVTAVGCDKPASSLEESWRPSMQPALPQPHK